ncbi:sugar phosphate isomerase/epimerase family protein [Paramicrobacterium agarici]|uniref:Sugar phosphate isomerase/epimerase n=1 Tax=Paramicrobacterium agarici TaxID=630514 RepID=A0A2A9DT72_9MICO|nr:sugar phosphate isomerase/epimerase [Microbacterium agarici]PFG29172.1 sugar phosphate isomerase/epimerase [Microbacterium agarici]
MTSSATSVQLYTVREATAQDLPGTLRRLADAGFDRVEPFAFTTFPELAAGLTDNGLAAPTTHQGFIADGSIEEVARAAASIGISTVIDPFVAPEKWTTAEDVADTARRLNEAATVAAQHGITVGYHNHAHEIENTIDGVTALEYFAGLLDPAVVLEVDTYWVAVGGADPVNLLATLGDRVVAIHVKDGPATAEAKDQVPVGQGSLDIPAILAAAPNALRVIELDDSRTDRFDAVVESLDYLRSLETGADA